MKRFLTELLRYGVGFAAVLVVIEIVLHVLPVARAPAVQPPTADNPIQRYTPSTPFTWSLGWDFYEVVNGRTNAQGFVADYDYRPAPGKPTLAVIGDSMVEALMVPYAKALPGLLQARLGDRAQVVSIAQSGSPLSQYVAYAAHACAIYHPERLVLVVIGNDFDESVYAHRVREGIYHLHPRADGGFDYRLTPAPPLGIAERVARHSALALYLIRNAELPYAIFRLRHLLGTWRRHLLGVTVARAETATPYVGGARAGTEPAEIAEGRAVLAWFLDALPRAACLPPSQITLVVDALRPMSDDPAQTAAARASYFGQLRDVTIAEAAAKGFAVIDAEIPMRADFTAAHQPFQFPTDAHWNARAHSVIADAVLTSLGNWP